MNKDSIFTLEQYAEAHEWLKNNHDYTIKEIEKVDGERRFCFDLKYEIKFATQIKYQTEIDEIKNWFDSSYAYKEQKFRRLISLNKLDDDGINGQTKLQLLYEEAEEKRKRIQELESKLKND